MDFQLQAAVVGLFAGLGVLCFALLLVGVLDWLDEL